MKLWLDTETVGLCGPCKLIQFAVDDGPVQMVPLYRGWRDDTETGQKLWALFKMLDDANTLFIGFNVAFDLFHLYRLRHLWHGFDERSADGRTMQPFRCQTLDLQVHAMMHSELAPFAFSRGRVRSIAAVRRIPKVATNYVRDLVESRLRGHIPDFFKLNCSERRVAGKPDLVTLAWSVDGSLSLKNLARQWGLLTIKLDEVWPLPDKGTEKPWLPYSDPAVHDRVEILCEQVMKNPQAPFWAYAKLDILLLRYAYERLGKPEPDIHSENCHCVAYTRFCGFDLDRNALNRSIEFYQARVDEASRELTEEVLKSAPKRLALLQAVDPLIGSSKKSVLVGLADSDRPSAELARKMLAFGPNRQRLLQLQKVRECATGKAHPDLRVMGTATLRAAGASGLNWQGIGAAEDLPPDPEVDDLPEDDASVDDEPEVEAQIEEDAKETERVNKVGLRACIKAPMVGDWAAFEVVLAATVYPDARILADLREGIDAHSMNAVLFHPDVRATGLDYAGFRLLVTQGDPWANKMRKLCKAVTFGINYGAAAPKIAQTLGISMAEAQAGLDSFYEVYTGFAEYRRQAERDFMTADTSHWTAESVGRMARHADDLTGHSRRWDFEADVADTLWRLGHHKICSGHTGQVTRTVEKGVQTIDNAIKSALLGSAIAIQSAVHRQAANSRVQMSGACINKMLGAALWKRLRVPILNIHDEWVFAAHPNFDVAAVSAVIDEFVAEWARKVPELRFDYKTTERWSDKK